MRSIVGRPEPAVPPVTGDNGSVAFQAVRAVALQVGFYLLGVGTVCILAAVPLAQFHVEGRIGIPGFAAAWAAISLAWALIPPWKRYEPPGMALDRETAPRLYRLVDEAAAELGISPPEEIALLVEANAMIIRRRVGFRRVYRLGVGLPLLYDLDVAELRAIVAHELGHLHHGDLSLGPWIYGTRQAIVRSLERMDNDGVGLHVLFNWYGRLYMRISQAVSRRQELYADRLAGRLCGRDAVVSSLRRIEELSIAWYGYWACECVPVLERGFRPPLWEGFGRYRTHKTMREHVERVNNERSRTSDAYDSHPSLNERCAALLEIGGPRHSHDATAASALFDDADVIEATLIRSIAIDHKDFPTISWRQAGERVWLPQWIEDVRPYQGVLKTVGPGNLPAAIADLDGWAWRLRGPGPAVLSPEAARRRALGLLGMWFAATLSWHQWTLDFAPGRAIRFSNDGHVVEPFTVVNDLREGRLTTSQWGDRCRELGFN